MSKTVKLSKEQLEIISSNPDDRLVSASAGTGKTSTMTERIASRIIAGKLSVENCLLLTFTEEAAKSMRMKLESVLRHAEAESEAHEKAYLREQILRLGSAKISTIHAFCKTLISEYKRHFPETNLEFYTDGSGGVLSDEEKEEALAAAFTSALEEYFKETDELWEKLSEKEKNEFYPPLWQFTELFGKAKNDESMIKALIEFYETLRSLPDYKEELRKKVMEAKSFAEHFKTSLPRKYFVSKLRFITERAANASREIERILKESPDLEFYSMATKSSQKKNAVRNAETRDSYLALVKNIYDIEAYLNSPDGADWDELIKKGSGLFLPQLRANKNDAEEKSRILYLSRSKIAELINTLNGSLGTDTYAKYFICGMAGVFGKSREVHEAELKEAGELLCCLERLINRADSLYFESKCRAGKLDFSDMEHYALKLIRLDSVAEELRERFSEIYVDEYQDTSSIQEEILRHLPQDRIFRVGDIKQSIYRFRHANPSLFLEHSKRLACEKSDCLHSLSINFRSEAGIINLVNAVFSQLMSSDAGGIDYRKEHRLLSGNGKKAEEAGALNIFIYDEEEILPPASAEVFTQEALPLTVLNSAVSELTGEGVKEDEISVLSRTNDSLQDEAFFLSRAGLNYHFKREKRLLSSLILRLYFALLRVAENPLQDNYLAALLLFFRPWGSIDIEELAEIEAFFLKNRGPGEKGFLLGKIRLYVSNGKNVDLKMKLENFLSRLETFRKAVKGKNLRDVFSHIGNIEGLYEEALSQNDGENKLSRIKIFEKWAGTFEVPGENALQNLNRKLEEHGDSLDIKDEEKEGENQGISLLTYHGSKGLDFPYVLIAAPEKKISAGSGGRDVISFSENGGLGISTVNGGFGGPEPTIVQKMIRNMEEEEDFYEEIRLLYVAMTRAKKAMYTAISREHLLSCIDLISSVLSDADEKSDFLSLNAMKKLAGKSSAALILGAFFRSGKLDLNKLKTFVEGNKGIYNRTYSCRELNFKTVSASETGETFIKRLSSELSEKEAALNKNSANYYNGKTKDELIHEMQKLNAGILPLKLKADRYAEASKTGIKFTVSEIKKRAYESAEDVGEGGAFSALPLQKNGVRDISRIMRPLYEKKGGVKNFTPAERGSLLHLALRYLRPGDYYSIDEKTAFIKIYEDIERLRRKGVFSEAEATEVLKYKDKLTGFLLSDLGMRIAAADRGLNGELIYREIPFTLALSSGRLFNSREFSDEDKALIQGIIDLWLQDAEGIMLLDYKSDVLRGSGEEIKREIQKRYKTQLEIYGMAIEKELGRKPDKTLIWLTDRSMSVEI